MDKMEFRVIWKDKNGELTVSHPYDSGPDAIDFSEELYVNYGFEVLGIYQKFVTYPPLKEVGAS